MAGRKKRRADVNENETPENEQNSASENNEDMEGEAEIVLPGDVAITDAEISEELEKLEAEAKTWEAYTKLNPKQQLEQLNKQLLELKKNGVRLAALEKKLSMPFKQ